LGYTGGRTHRRGKNKSENAELEKRSENLSGNQERTFLHVWDCWSKVRDLEGDRPLGLEEGKGGEECATQFQGSIEIPR